MRIEVFNPCDENDDQKTSTAILFDNENKFLGNTLAHIKLSETQPSRDMRKC